MSLDGKSLTVSDVAALAAGAPAVVPDAAWERMERSAGWFAAHGNPHIIRDKWEWLLGGEAPGDLTRAVRAFLAGHCASVGEPLSSEEVRALIVVRLNVLLHGHTGCRPVVGKRLLELLNRNWLPVIPRTGSVGAAGSSTLAHLAWAALGFGGKLIIDGKPVDAAGPISTLEPLKLNEKEALSLINGSALTTALGCLAIHRASSLLVAAQKACALSMEVVKADRNCLSAAALAARGHAGGMAVGQTLRELTRGSELVTPQRRPDSFAVRCAPTVLGTAHTALAHVTEVVHTELNGAADNPLVFENEVVEGGHFHGAPVSLALDHLKAAMVGVGSISERRIFRMTYGQLSGLPSFLVEHSGANSGLMLAQYTAASLVSEARAFSMPGSVDTVPTVQHHEDHVSMGPVSARSALAIVDLVADVVGIELLVGAQGLDFRLSGRAVDASGQSIEVAPARPGVGTQATYDAIRSKLTRWTDDRILHVELETLGQMVRAGVFS